MELSGKMIEVNSKKIGKNQPVFVVAEIGKNFIQTNKLIIISSGMSSLEELDKSVDFLKKKIDRIILMHCVSKYPCPPEDLNLKTIEFLKKRYDLPVGFSDHSLGQQGALPAIELGAVVIEKHFSFSRDLWGADHKVSMTPAEFKQMVE